MSDWLKLLVALGLLVVGFWLWAEVDHFLARRRYRRDYARRRRTAAVFDEAARARALERLREPRKDRVPHLHYGPVERDDVIPPYDVQPDQEDAPWR